MARMRTAEGVMAIIREQDPKTQVTVHAIRRLIASGKVPVTCCGRKYLVDADAMIEFTVSILTEQVISSVRFMLVTDMEA